MREEKSTPFGTHDESLLRRQPTLKRGMYTRGTRAVGLVCHCSTPKALQRRHSLKLLQQAVVMAPSSPVKVGLHHYQANSRCWPSLVTSLACLLAVIDLQVGCSQIEVTGLLDVSRCLLVLSTELVIVLYQLHPFLILLDCPCPPVHMHQDMSAQPTLCLHDCCVSFCCKPQSHKDVILLGHLLVCAKSVNLHTCTVLMGTDLVRSLNNRLELLVISLECHTARVLSTTEEGVQLRLMQAYSTLTSLKQSGKGDSRHTWPA